MSWFQFTNNEGVKRNINPLQTPYVDNMTIRDDLDKTITLYNYKSNQVRIKFFLDAIQLNGDDELIPIGRYYELEDGQIAYFNTSKILDHAEQDINVLPSVEDVNQTVTIPSETLQVSPIIDTTEQEVTTTEKLINVDTPNVNQSIHIDPLHHNYQYENINGGFKMTLKRTAYNTKDYYCEYNLRFIGSSQLQGAKLYISSVIFQESFYNNSNHIFNEDNEDNLIVNVVRPMPE